MIATLTTCTALDALEVTAYDNGKRAMGWMLPKSHGALAKRLVRAIEAGVAVTHDGAGYTTAILGRTMNADLRRLGF